MMTIHTAPCFCCSGQLFAECCEPVLQDHARAVTPLKLMRSRYTAYVLKNADHLMATWHLSTRPDQLALDEREVRWLQLDILSQQPTEPHDTTGEVEFMASYLEADQLCTIHETSRFTLQDGLWYYLDGDCELQRRKIGRNSPCPCGSGKKFKRCCVSN